MRTRSKGMGSLLMHRANHLERGRKRDFFNKKPPDHCRLHGWLFLGANAKKASREKDPTPDMGGKALPSFRESDPAQRSAPQANLFNEP